MYLFNYSSIHRFTFPCIQSCMHSFIQLSAGAPSVVYFPHTYRFCVCVCVLFDHYLMYWILSWCNHVCLCLFDLNFPVYAQLGIYVIIPLLVLYSPIHGYACMYSFSLIACACASSCVYLCVYYLFMYAIYSMYSNHFFAHTYLFTYVCVMFVVLLILVLFNHRFAQSSYGASIDYVK